MSCCGATKATKELVNINENTSAAAAAMAAEAVVDGEASS
jgi:hypothetical protein